MFRSQLHTPTPFCLRRGHGFSCAERALWAADGARAQNGSRRLRADTDVHALKMICTRASWYWYRNVYELIHHAFWAPDTARIEHLHQIICDTS